MDQDLGSVLDDQLLPSNKSDVFVISQSASSAGDLISDEEFNNFNIYFLQMSLSLVSSVGIVTNVMNVMVYWKHVPRYGVTSTFIFLSVSDVASCVFSLLSICCYVIQGHWPIRSVNMLAIQYAYLGYSRGCAYVISTCLTVYLSVERCFCIKFPLNVKVILAPHRSLLIKFSIVVFGLACFTPAWATQGLQVVFDTTTNETHLDLWLADCRREIDLFVDTFAGVVIPTVAQVVITVCAVFIINGLKSSAEFRQVASGKQIRSKLGEKTLLEDLGDKAQTIMTSKEAKAAKVVVLVAVLFFACNVPVLLVAYTRMFITELDFGKMYYKLYNVLYTVVYASGLVNACVNIVIYYTVSAKFKSVFLSLFCKS
ncbi:alpha-1A adrenergic receptor-like [Biomphalaria glabrata]|uniref:Alpha-1A adrenergic receptor-like n=1 Tax=Biomphalaria glabrata TaxID=6526 RepID=A0A9W2YIQ1_BIOGL|nr:alpha-1A adrenergic receptor-like [Biomphalaria glabrata]